MTFLERLEAAQKRSNSTLAVGLAPELKRLPYQFQSYDEPFLPFSTAMIDATADLVCAYVFHLGAYLMLGAAGAIALERAIGYTPSHVIKILHGPFVGQDMIHAAFEGFGVDAVTLGDFQDRTTFNGIVSDMEHGFLVYAPGADLFTGSGIPGETEIGYYQEFASRHHDCLWPWHKNMVLEWYDDIVYASPADDFREAAHRAAEKVRQPFTLQTRSNQ